MAAPAIASIKRAGHFIPGLQLYMLGPEPFRDLPGTLAAVRSIGYEDVELPSLLGKSPDALASALRQADLRCPSVHVPLSGRGFTLDQPSQVADTLKSLGAQFAIVPSPTLSLKVAPGQDYAHALASAIAAEGPDDWRRLADRLNAAAAKLAPYGLTVGYHNHDLELHPFGNSSETPIDVLRTSTEQSVVFELDLGWVAAAGGDPLATLRRFRGRVALAHLKDIAARSAADTAMTMTSAEPGKGIIDWKDVVPALAKAGVKHAYLEQEPPFDGPRIEAARRGFEFFNRFRSDG